MGLHAFARYVKNVQLSELSRAAAVPSWVDGGFSSEMPCGGYYFIMSSLHCHHTHTRTHTSTHVWCLNRFMRKEREQGRIPFNWIAPGGCITIALLIRPGDPGRAGLGRDCNRLLMLLLLLFNCRLQRSQKESKGRIFHQLTMFAYANWSINCEALQAKQQKKRSQVGSALVIMNITHGKHLQEISFKKCFVFSFHYSLLNRSLLCTELLTT